MIIVIQLRYFMLRLFHLTPHSFSCGCGTEPILFVRMLHFRDWRNAASLRYRNRAEPFLCVNRSPTRYSFVRV